MIQVMGGMNRRTNYRPHRPPPHPPGKGHDILGSPQRNRNYRGTGAQRQPSRPRPERGFPPRRRSPPFGKHPRRPALAQMTDRGPQSPQRKAVLAGQGNGPEGSQGAIQQTALPPQFIQSQKSHRTTQGQPRHQRIQKGKMIDGRHHRPPGNGPPPLHRQRRRRRRRPRRRPTEPPQRPPPSAEARYRRQVRRTTKPEPTGGADGCEVGPRPARSSPPSAPPGGA